MERMLWLIERVKSAKFHAGDLSLDDAQLLDRPIEVDSDQIKMFWEQSALYHMGDCQHTQNIQINKVIGENEKRVLYFTGKTIQTLRPTRLIF